MQLYIKHKKIKISVFVLMVIVLFLNIISNNHPQLLENIYSDGFNRYTRIVISNITGIFPFSVAEVLIIAGVFVLAFMIFKLFKGFFKGKWINELSNILLFLSLLYIIFMILWGYNYSRYSIGELTNLSVSEYSSEELSSLCSVLIEEVNSLRDLVTEDSEGIMTTEGGYKSVIRRAGEGYDKLSTEIPELRGHYGKVKPLLMSYLMMYTGITGIYIPYTAEANINICVDNYSLPHTIAHEMAHQRGFAPENEANYIAYLACMESPYYDFKYSGAVTALIYSMSALRKDDYSTYLILRDNFSDGLNRDLAYSYEYWQQFEGAVEKVTTTVNNTYLITNGQEEGVKSYGKMVDLLLSHFIDTGKIY